MPLDRRAKTLLRATVTLATRIMLPTYALIDAGIGAIWVLQDRDRTSAAIIALQGLGWPITGSGAVLLVLGFLCVAGMLLQSRATTAIVVGAGAAVWLALAVIYTHSVLGDPRASLSTPLLPLGWAVAHIATLASLAVEELTDDRGNHRVWEASE